MYRGSRKHILDWAEKPRFLPELLALARPVECRITADSLWLPLGYRTPDEARLERFGPRAIPGSSAWKTLREWWLRHERGANTPNWDIALSCLVEGTPGLLLVEAKANAPELDENGKAEAEGRSTKSKDNHEQIGKAIAEARQALSNDFPNIRIDRDRSYQLSNRIAFAWKLASLDIPTVLIYLGFTGDTGIASTGQPFINDAHWSDHFTTHLRKVCPPTIVDRRNAVGHSAFWLLVRSRPILETSPEVL